MSLNIDGTVGVRYGTQPPTQTRPYDFGTDAIERQRVSLGQAMMDADFEYGLQATKWQSYVDVRKFPSFFEIPGSDFTFSNVVSDGAPVSNISVYYASTVQGVTQGVPPVGSFISMFSLTPVRASLADRAEGYFVVTANNAATSYSANYIAKGYVPSGNIQSNFTFSRRANVYNSGTCTIPFSNIWSDGSSNLQVYTSNAHGLLPGFPLTATQSTATGNAGYSNFFGTFYVSNVTSANSFNIVANTSIFGSAGTTQVGNLLSSNTTLYISQFASQQHRPYDGGVLLSTLSPAHGSTVCRQSKKAFRYQSGKGILFSSGTLFSPQLDIASINLFGVTTTTTGSITGTSPRNFAVASSANFQVGQIIASYIGQNLGTATITAIPDGSTLTVAWTTTQSINVPVGTVITTLPIGSNIQIVTDALHGIPTTGATVNIRNFTSSVFNGNYTISGVLDSRTVNVQSQAVLTSTLYNLGDQPRLVITGWHGSSVRAGCFEDPNGLFWEYDGQTLAVVRRQSTFATAGYVTTAPQSQVLTGTTVPGVSGAVSTMKFVSVPINITNSFTGLPNSLTFSPLSSTPAPGVLSVGSTTATSIVVNFNPSYVINLQPPLYGWAAGQTVAGFTGATVAPNGTITISGTPTPSTFVLTWTGTNVANLPAGTLITNGTGAGVNGRVLVATAVSGSNVGIIVTVQNLPFVVGDTVTSSTGFSGSSTIISVNASLSQITVTNSGGTNGTVTAGSTITDSTVTNAPTLLTYSSAPQITTTTAPILAGTVVKYSSSPNTATVLTTVPAGQSTGFTLNLTVGPAQFAVGDTITGITTLTSPTVYSINQVTPCSVQVAYSGSYANIPAATSIGDSTTGTSYISSATTDSVGGANPNVFSTAIGDTQTTVTLAGAAVHTIQQSMQALLPGLGMVWIVGAVDFLQFTIGFVPTPSAISININQLTGATWSLPTTRFQDQLRVNDRFTIRGMVHQVTGIQGQGQLTFNPPYRGTSTITPATPVKCCKIKELRIPQSQFNRDTIDGRGPSGYKVDLSRQQMIGIQYTWYGAGFVDFMMRGPDGNWVMCHRIKNNNVNDEAYMRSGNLPVRYELSVESRACVSTLASNISTTATTITINDATTYFPPANATLLVDNELIYYTGTTTNSFTGCTRAASLVYNTNDIQRTFTSQGTGPGTGTTHLANTSVNLISCTATPTMTHWGSSFLTDGGFDSERGYYFNYSNVNVTVGGTSLANLNAGNLTGATAFAVRLAPSVTNGFVGDIGSKELLNRAQLLLQKLEVTSANNIVTVGFLNPTNVYFNPANWININNFTNGSQPSFAQYYPGGLVTTTPQPGERIFQTIVQANYQNNLDLAGIKELTNGCIGGNAPFPDGPDVLLVYCQNLSSVPVSNQVNLFWSEAQA